MQRQQLIVSLAVTVAACAYSNESMDPDVDPDCKSCRADGNSCIYSLNCQPGSICNSSDEEYFDSAVPEDVCTRVICVDDSECDLHELCSLSGTCQPRGCQTDTDCPIADEICIGGACETPVGIENADRCEVVEGHITLLSGQSAGLDAVVRDVDGRVLVGVPVVWASDAPDTAFAADTIVRPGPVPGDTTLRARLPGLRDCEGQISVHYLGPAAGLRVSVVAAADGAPIANAEVTLMATSQVTLQTDARGTAVTSDRGPIAWVTVDVGHEKITIMAPGARDLVVAVPTTRSALAGGVRGAVDISRARSADVLFGLVGPGLPAQLLDVGRTRLIGEDLSVADPMLAADRKVRGGFLLGLGENVHTDAAQRCGPVSPQAGELGCYLFGVPRDISTVWTSSGRLKLSWVTGRGEDLEGGGEFGAQRQLVTAIQLQRRLRYGAEPYVHPPYSRRIAANQSIDCSDLSTTDYLDVCRPDYTTYEAHSLTVTHTPDLFSVIQVPELPGWQGSRCASFVSVIVASDLGRRGLVPLGFGGAPDTATDIEAPDCKVAGENAPFGLYSSDIADGTIAMAAVPRHNGLESGRLTVLEIAHQPSIDASPARSIRIHRPERIDSTMAWPGAFPEPPVASIQRNIRTVRGGVPQSTGIRVEVFAPGRRWTIYAPPSPNGVRLPALPATDAILNVAQAGVFTTYNAGMTYSKWWDANAPERLVRMSSMSELAVQGCTTATTARCRIY